jgi:hypothetical protein
MPLWKYWYLNIMQYIVNILNGYSRWHLWTRIQNNMIIYIKQQLRLSST